MHQVRSGAACSEPEMNHWILTLDLISQAEVRQMATELVSARIPKNIVLTFFAFLSCVSVKNIFEMNIYEDILNA